MQQNDQKIRKRLNNEFKNFETIQKVILKNQNTDTSSLSYVFYYPLSNSVIISGFGIHDHPYIKNVKVKNDGIDLYSRTDSIVKASAEGVVRSIITLPSHTKSIIIQHHNYFTVYSYVCRPIVKTGDTVFSLQPIAFVDKNYNKYKFPVLNFQIWKQTNKLNPAKYLER